MISNNVDIDQFEGGETILRYEGVFSDEVTEQSVMTLEKELPANLGINLRLKNRIIYLFVEQFQNVIRHGIVKNNAAGPEGKISVHLNKDFCIIRSQNYCDSVMIKKFIVYIEELNNLSEIEVKERYKYHLEENTLSEKGGAGLGLLDMRRRAKNKLRAKLINEDTEDCIFCLSVRIELE